MPETGKRGPRLLSLAKGAAFYAILGLGSVVMLAPLVWMLSTASKSLAEAISPGFRLLPGQFLLWENVRTAFTRAPMGRYYLNSSLVASTVVVGRVLLCSLAGYSFAKYSYPGRNVLFTLVLSTMMIPFFVVVIPLYIVVYSLGWLNTYPALIVPALVDGFGIFLMRQFMIGIHPEFIDAARIDGASEVRVFWRIIMPLSQPAIATLAIFTFMGSWDSYVWPLLVITKQDMMTIPLGLVVFNTQYVTFWNELMAAALVGMSPTFLLFLVFQRQFVQGMVLSGLKG